MRERPVYLLTTSCIFCRPKTWCFTPEKWDEPFWLKRLWQGLPCFCCPFNLLRLSEVTTPMAEVLLEFHQPAVFEGKTPSYKMGPSSVQLAPSMPFGLLCLPLLFQKNFMFNKHWGKKTKTKPKQNKNPERGQCSNTNLQDLKFWPRSPCLFDLWLARRP